MPESLIHLEGVTKVFITDEVETHALAGIHGEVAPPVVAPLRLVAVPARAIDEFRAELGTLNEDVLRFLDNVLTHFITVAPDSMQRARYSALRERSVGLGVMGFHSFLQAQGIPTAIYYPKSMHQQTAYRGFPVAEGGLPVSEKLSDDVISLPMHAYLDEVTQVRIIDAVRRALGG